MHTILNVRELIRASHAMAVEKGWWTRGDDGCLLPRSWIEQCNNFHAEVSEAWEEYRAGRADVWMAENGKPEGFLVEVADLLIRLADTCGSLGIVEFQAPDRFPSVDTKERLIDALHGQLQALRNSNGLPEHISAIFSTCFDYASRALSTEHLWSAISLKMDYNATRPFRHGNKLA